MMVLILALVLAVLTGVGTRLLLQTTFLHKICGLALWSHAVHLLLLTLGRVGDGEVPILREQTTSVVDPLPQALILTSIVIGFALTAFMIVLGMVVARQERAHES